MATVPTTEELAGLFDQGGLASEMANEFGLNDEVEIQTVTARLAELHNTGTRDLLRLIENNAMQELDTHHFFTAAHFFNRILPELETTPTRMMACIEALVARGGEDLVANQPNAAFRAWCEKDARRAHEIIAAARAGEGLASRNLTFALEAVGSVTEARQIMLACDDDTRRLSAITALGRIDDDDPTSQRETLVAFNMLLDSGVNDNLRSNILHSVAVILARGPDACLPDAVNLIGRLVADVKDVTIHVSARILYVYPKILRPEIVAALLKALSHINPANKGTVAELDHGLRSLLHLGYDEAATDYVTQLFCREDQTLQLEELHNFTSTLLSGPPERVSRVVARWLLLGTPRLCEGLAKALHGRGTDGPALNIRAEDLAVSPSAQVFICRKAIGWFILKPTTAASVAVSILRICDGETAEKVQKLLVETLLLNYGGLRDYFAALAPDDPAKARVGQCVAENDAYLHTLGTVPFIKELEPSEHHRRIEWLRRSDEMRDVMKQARSKSVLASLVKNSVLLYGNRALSFVRNGDDTLRPIEMELKPYSISMEMPRMQTIDPVGLDIMIRVFRSEKMTS